MIRNNFDLSDDEYHAIVEPFDKEIKKGLVYLNLDDIINGSYPKKITVQGTVYSFELVNCLEDDGVVLDVEKCRGAVFRTRDDCDVFTLKKRKVTKSLKKYFNEIKMPAEKRYSVPLVAVDNNVLWIDGIGAAYDVEFSKISKRGIKISVSRH